MTALDQIAEAIKEARRNEPRNRYVKRRLKVLVGRAAEQSIKCAVEGHTLPLMIDGCAVERTLEFAGWELVEI